MFALAYEQGFAVPAFNLNGLESVQAIAAAAAAEDAPVIFQVCPVARKYFDRHYLAKLIEAALLTHDVVAALNLDHGLDVETALACVDEGFTSVMIDGSKHPFEENIRMTREVVRYAHDRGVSVEAELGKIAGVEESVSISQRQASYTDPDEAVEFVEKSGCDSLAVSIGTAHGAYKYPGDPELDFDRLDRIQKKLPGFPIVLHGASSVPPKYVKLCTDFGAKLPGAVGVPEEMLARAASMAVCKVNINTDLTLAMTGTIRKVFAENPSEFEPRCYIGPGRDVIRDEIRHKLRLLGASGKAADVRALLAK